MADKGKQQDPFLDWSALPSENENFAEPVVEHYKFVLANQQCSAMVIAAIYLVSDAVLGRWDSFRAVFLVAGFLVSWGLKTFISRQSATNGFFELYNVIILTVGAIFYSCAVWLMHQAFNKFFFTVVFTLWPCYYLPQFCTTYAVMTFLAYHIASLAAFYSNDMCDVIYANVGVCVFQTFVVINRLSICNNAMKCQAQRATTTTQSTCIKLMQVQIQDLLERSFDGLVRVQDGKVKWGNTKFWKLFPDLRSGDQLESQFTDWDVPKIRGVCAGERSAYASIKKSSRKCEIFAAPTPPGNKYVGLAPFLAIRMEDTSRDGFDSLIVQNKFALDLGSGTARSEKWHKEMMFWADVASGITITKADAQMKKIFGDDVTGKVVSQHVDNPVLFLDRTMQALAECASTKKVLGRVGSFELQFEGSKAKVQASWHLHNVNSLRSGDGLCFVLRDIVVTS
eukprot:TRINITY_DN49129_c0_g1_i1.p1 TRINITY_DN49129_c0_g1~~TRINITY_DN49129_c0_g1_i1.p1  ORF type:complete len:453 (+),score=93.39 TRINITY_DN49129_c0_g1_i1:104-1462(+)